LALSSRNRYLSPAARAQAAGLYGALAALRGAFNAGVVDAAELALIGNRSLAQSGAWDIEYLAVVDPLTLEARELAQAGDRVLAAARVDGIRLIDNIGL
jgi:pantoate--beta-alanine ligase